MSHTVMIRAAWRCVAATGILGLLLAGCAHAVIEVLPTDPVPVLPPAVAADDYTDAIASARVTLAQLRSDRRYPGLSIAVAVGSRLVWVSTEGLSNVNGRLPVTPESQFPIGSVSKTLTAAVAMRLVEQRRLDLDQPIHRYVPSFPRKRYSVTLRQLLSHQAGIRHYKIGLFQPGFSESNLNREFSSVEASLALFRNDALKFEPDTRFLYSTFGYTLVSAAIEGATGRPFLEIMRAELFDPLGMSRTEPDGQSPSSTNRTVDYVAGSDPRSVRTARRTNSSYKWAGGGFLSTPTDLAAFAMALLEGRIVSPDTRALMFTPRRLSNGTENAQRYGLGWRASTITDQADPARIITLVHHGGTAVGSEAVLLMLPESRVVVAITGNAHTGGSGAMIQTASVIARRFAQGH